MSVYIDRKYLLLISHRLELFKQKKDDLYNFRCPICGDSKKNLLKARGYVYRKNNDYFMTCHNCHAGLTMYNFLSHVDPSLTREYALERYSNNETKNHNYPKNDILENFKTSTPKFKKKQELPLDKISKLHKDHFAKQYVVDRKIPQKYHPKLYYTKDFKKFIKEFNPDIVSESLEKIFDDDQRLVIPFYDNEGNIFAIQGRTLTGSKIRYITIKLNENSPKIYGIERVNTNNTIYVVEGPLDSLFLDNCIATADSNLSFATQLFNKESMVLVFDNEPRNKQIVKQIEKCIKQGFTICLFPDTIKEKDINDMILSGKTKEEIHQIIEKNTFLGPRAEMEFSLWKKC